MLTPQDIKSAIPRQKVLKDGYSYNVLAINPDNTMILQLADLSQKDKAMQTWSYAKPEDCEIVPEEPRGFKVGDKVVYEYEDGRLEYTIIQAIRKLGDDYTIFTPGDTYETAGETMRYRHATPEEVAKYFN